MSRAIRYCYYAEQDIFGYLCGYIFKTSYEEFKDWSINHKVEEKARFFNNRKPCIKACTFIYKNILNNLFKNILSLLYGLMLDLNN